MPLRREPAVGVMPFERLAIFIDGANFKYSCDGLGASVDMIEMLNYLSKNALLIRAYYYAGEWTNDTIEAFLEVERHRGKSEEDLKVKREELLRTQQEQFGFRRMLSRNGYMVRTKPIRVYAGGRMKADLDLELAIDMMTLADRCDRQILASGDGDFVPLVHAVTIKGVRVDVLSTLVREVDGRQVKATASGDLLDAADGFIELNEVWRNFQRRVPAPARAAFTPQKR